ncbi:MAG: endonuclease/exonuclease/phosphatase family protein [Candidatus Rhabdochlamydia sp.]
MSVVAASQYGISIRFFPSIYPLDLLKKKTFRFASLLTEPACKAHELFRRLYLVDVLNPTASKTSNWARKFFLGMGLVVSSFLSIGTTIPGAALRGITSHLEKEPFIYYQGKLPDEALKDDFSLLSWNICCVGGGYSISDGGVMPWPFRIDNIIAKINEEDPDILALYEVMDTAAGFHLYEKLQERYAHFYFNIGPRAIGPSSGIFVASKAEIKNPEFTPFPKQILVGRTKISEKGVFSFDVYVEEKKVKVYATHLQHSEQPQYPTEEEVEARKKEMDLIIKKAHQETGNIIVTGDLNLDNAEYAKSSWVETFQDVSFDENGSRTWGGDEFCAKMVGKRDSGPLNLDYTLITKKSEINGKTSLVETGYDDTRFTIDALSDHKGLLSRFELNKN